MLNSIEAEEDTLVALLSVVGSAQVTIRHSVNIVEELEDALQQQKEQIRRLEERGQYLERSWERMRIERDPFMRAKSTA